VISVNRLSRRHRTKLNIGVRKIIDDEICKKSCGLSKSCLRAFQPTYRALGNLASARVVSENEAGFEGREVRSRKIYVEDVGHGRCNCKVWVRTRQFDFGL
jgi:hypothetical protein